MFIIWREKAEDAKCTYNTCLTHGNKAFEAVATTAAAAAEKM